MWEISPTTVSPSQISHHCQPHSNALPLSAPLKCPTPVSPTHLSRTVQGFNQFDRVHFFSAHCHSHCAATAAITTTAPASHSAAVLTIRPTHHRGGNITHPTRGGIPHHRARPPQCQRVAPPSRTVLLLGSQVGEAGAEAVELEIAQAHPSFALGEEEFEGSGGLWGGLEVGWGGFDG